MYTVRTHVIQGRDQQMDKEVKIVEFLHHIPRKHLSFLTIFYSVISNLKEAE